MVHLNFLKSYSQYHLSYYILGVSIDHIGHTEYFYDWNLQIFLQILQGNSHCLV